MIVVHEGICYSLTEDPYHINNLVINSLEHSYLYELALQASAEYFKALMPAILNTRRNTLTIQFLF